MDSVFFGNCAPPLHPSSTDYYITNVYDRTNGRNKTLALPILYATINIIVEEYQYSFKEPIIPETDILKNSNSLEIAPHIGFDIGVKLCVEGLFWRVFT